MLLTVAICTRNPRQDYLARVLAALAQQTLAHSAWELLILDSASDQPLSATLALPAGLACRFVRLDKPGLLRARFAAIAAATAPVLLFLDDDNVPTPDFLARGLELADQWPMLGVWGPARIIPECETPPHATIAPHLVRMACCDFPADRWSNTLDVIPPGAGMFLRTASARAYALQVEHDPRRELVGEGAGKFFRGEDTDLVFHVIKSGLGAAQFHSLYLTHLIPSRRLEPDYVVRLAEAAAGSAMVVNYFWAVLPRRESVLDRLVYHLKALRFRGLDRRIAQAHRRGEHAARALIRELSATRTS